MKPMIAPSLLSADFVNLGRDVALMESAGAELLHLDVMDGHFVPNLTIGLPVVEALRNSTDLKLDVHLMIANPDQLAEDFVRAGADLLSVHYEAATHLHRILDRVRTRGAKAGVVLNPHSPVPLLDEVLEFCDFVLIMSVNPGFGGQTFIDSSFKKVRKLKMAILERNLEVQVEIDGGMGPENTEAAVTAGVDMIVSGSRIFKSEDPVGAFQEMQQIAENARRCPDGLLAK